MLNAVIIVPVIVAFIISLAGLAGYKYVATIGGKREQAYTFTMKLLYIALGMAATTGVNTIVLIIAYGITI